MTKATGGKVLPEVANAEAEAHYRIIQPKYVKLAGEVEYILQEALVEERIPIASLSKRVKSVASFAGKLRRKNYSDPLSEMTDLAGVRIVSYFRGDLPRLEQMIEQHFQVHEKVDKFAEKETDQFGYMAIHFTVSLKVSYSGARYDDLKELKCEIQVRPVLADAWAILNHYLMYKKETAVPADLERKMVSLAAILENADSQVEGVHREIDAHREKAKRKTGDEFLEQPINHATVAAFIERMFPGIQASDKEASADFICSLLDRTRFHTLADIESAVQRTKKAVSALKRDTTMFAAQELEYALAFADTSMRRRYADWFKALFARHRDLVEKPDSTDV